MGDTQTTYADYFNAMLMEVACRVVGEGGVCVYVRIGVCVCVDVYWCMWGSCTGRIEASQRSHLLPFNEC